MTGPMTRSQPPCVAVVPTSPWNHHGCAALTSTGGDGDGSGAHPCSTSVNAATGRFAGSSTFRLPFVAWSGTGRKSHTADAFAPPLMVMLAVQAAEKPPPWIISVSPAYTGVLTHVAMGVVRAAFAVLVAVATRSRKMMIIMMWCFSLVAVTESVAIDFDGQKHRNLKKYFLFEIIVLDNFKIFISNFSFFSPWK